MSKDSLLVVLVLLAWPLRARGEGEARWESKPPAPVDCVPRATGDASVDEALKSITFDVGGEARPLREIRFEGLTTIKEDDLWTFLGGKPEKPEALRATAIVRRLATSGLFEQVSPVLRVQGESVAMIVRLIEQPRLTRVVLEGLTEAKPKRLLEALLETPPKRGKEEKRRKRGDDDEGETRACVELPIPATWVAGVDDEAVRPGIVWKGLRRGVQRVVDRLFDRGYQMSTLSGELSPDGTLTIRVDEGRLQSVEVRGVSPRVEGRVRELLQLQPGMVFDREDLGGALRRVRAEFPFLDSDGKGRLGRVRPRVVEEVVAGGRHYRLVENDLVNNGGWSTVEGNRLVLYMRARRGELEGDPSELIRHTPVTGFAPGAELSGRYWDPGNRVHVSVDLAGNVNTHRAQQGPSAQLPAVAPAPGERWRFDWMVGPKVEIPALHVAELGVQLYARVDTADRWRLDRVDSYVYSILLNRPDSEYFRRQGFTAFATTHLLERVTVGVEYRRDEYLSLATPQKKYWTLFRRNETPRVNPGVDDGTMASLLLRLEYSSASIASHKVGKTQRDPERSIVRHDAKYWWSDFHTVNTLEIADPGLGGDQFKFVRVVSDSAAVVLRTAPNTGLKVRFRAAGRLSGTLPAQKEEALGGWSALRGYGFKELRDGNVSLLGTIEYRRREASAFVDIGSVRSGAAFGPLRTGLGVALNLQDRAQLALAWRTDDKARLMPEVRLLFNRAF